MAGQILRVIEREPDVRSRYLAAPTDTPYVSANRTLEGNQFYPYYIQLVARDLLNFLRTHLHKLLEYVFQYASSHAISSKWWSIILQP
jgi:hypothetical protein